MHAPTPAAWAAFVRTFLWTAGVFGVACYAFILVLDPYSVVPFSPRWDRAPVDTNQRFSYPSIARDARFDAVVIGTSTARSLDPKRLGAGFGATFANLAMNSATAWEQDRMARLFLRSRPVTRYLLLGVDVAWCGTGTTLERVTFRLFPEWMYDDNRWNDLLFLFNDKALEQAVRQAQYLLGMRRGKYRRDGFRDFLPPEAGFDGRQFLGNLYGAADPVVAARAPLPDIAARARQPALNFPAHPLLRDLLAAIPPETTTVLFFPPYHIHHQRAVARTMSECKARIATLARARPGTRVVDFMLPSALTREDAHYWDVLHYGRKVARRLEAALPAAVTATAGEPDLYELLVPGRAPP